jgi:lipid-binding SYLF domain-containing protein
VPRRSDGTGVHPDFQRKFLAAMQLTGFGELRRAKMKRLPVRLVAACLALSAAIGSPAEQASAATAAELNANGKAALSRLYSQSQRAVRYSRDAHAILVFPKIVKAGFMIGGQGGEGVLFERGKAVGYYKIGAASFGLQAGGQSFSYALFFMNDKALKYLKDSDGWSIGSGPSVVVVDKGAAMSTTSTTLAKDVYAFPFGQKGLMAGLGLEGSKISRINR